MSIHPSSIISPKAKIGKNVTIGPFCIIGDDVILEDNVVIHSHVSIACKVHIHSGVEIFPFVSLDKPQDLKYQNEPSEIIIGKNTILRESVTINPGTKADRMKTVIGENCLLMIGVHVAHDCIIGDKVIMANYATLAGHVVIEDGAIIGGLSAVHQKVRIGRYAIVGGMSGIDKDVLPYSSARCDRAFWDGLNLIGLKRAGIDRQVISELKTFYNELFSTEQELLDKKIARMEEKYKNNKCIMDVINFMKKDSGHRSICMPKKIPKHAEENTNW